MKKFVFPLESVLAAKRLLEQEAKKNLAQAQERLVREQQRLAELNTEKDRALDSWYELVQNGFRSQSLLQEVHHINALREQIEQQHKVTDRVAQARNLCQEQLREIFTEVKSLKTLRDQQLAAYLAEEAREKDKEMDEFVSGAFHRAIQLGSHA
ncbi:MAG: flagellar export protein FliJ [Eubacteriales bacterium]|nr:flagellar export protein FliJ [Eubacteriales bacterium]